MTTTEPGGPRRRTRGDPVRPRAWRGRDPIAQLLLALTLGLGACQACGPSTAERRAAVGVAQGELTEAHAEGASAARRDATRRVAESAHTELIRALDAFDHGDVLVVLAHCGGMRARGALDEALACLETAVAEGHTGSAVRLLQADALSELERWPEAREVLFGLRDRDPDMDGLQARLLAAFTHDTHFSRPVETLEVGRQFTHIRALGGGSTVTLKFKLDDVTIAAFKPDQTRRQSNYRAEIAAYRLCPIIRCGFEIPYSYEVRIEQREFLRGYGIPSLVGQTGYAENFVDLIFTTEDGGRYLHGVWKDWVPHFTEFPIEYDDLWDSWVSVRGDPAQLDLPLSEALTPLRGRDRGNYQEILDEALETTTRDLARQISNLIAFDFLINNWDRFSGAYYGVNCQWANGVFTSIDNGAGFMTRDPVRPRARLSQVTRFSRSLVAEVRRLDPEALLPILFPEPTEEERRNFEVFWERRDELLRYVDELIEAHGEDAVLLFE